MENSSESQVIKEKLLKFSDKLLDLSKRNKMINSNFQTKSKTRFRIIDEIPDLLYQKLSSGDMEFKPLPLLDHEPKDENTTEFKEKLTIAEMTNEEYINEIKKIEEEQKDDLNEAYGKALRKLKDKVRDQLGLPPRSTKDTPLKDHAKNHRFSPNFDLPSPDDNSKNIDKWNDRKIQTLMLPDNLNKSIDSIYKKYKSSLKETGVNPLFFCFGFLEWTGSYNSNQRIYSPLLTLQVVFDDKNKKKRLVDGVGSDLSLNEVLNEKLKKDFGFQLPELKENGGCPIDKYLEKVKKKIKENHPHWKVRNWAAFGLYNAQNMPICRDLKDIAQKENHRELLERILLGKSPESNDSENYNPDDRKHNKDIPALVEEADFSQYSTILDVIREKNIVIQGPPGTGKSQTITNMIAALLSKGKKVLFVAQKQAALDIVKNKLKANGLDNYILEVFSSKANKKDIIESIKKRLKSNKPYLSKELDKKVEQLYNTKEKLNGYAELMAKEIKNTGFTVHDILWLYDPVKNEKVILIKNVELLNKDSIKDNIQSLESIKDICLENNVKTLKENPIHLIKKLPIDYIGLQSVIGKLKSFCDQFELLIKKEQNILETNKGLKDKNENFFEQPLVKKWCDLEEKNQKQEKEKLLRLLKVVFNSDSKKLLEIIKKIESLQSLAIEKEEQPQIFNDEIKKVKKEHDEICKKNKEHKEKVKLCFNLDRQLSSDSIKKAEQIYKKGNIFSFFFREYREATELLKSIWKQKFPGDFLVMLPYLYSYLEDESGDRKKEQELKNTINQFEEELRKIIKQLQEFIESLEQITNDLCKKIEIQTNIENVRETLEEWDFEELKRIIKDSNELSSELKQGWLNQPDSLISYKKFLKEEKELIESCKKELLDLLDIDINLIYQNSKYKSEDLLEFLENIKNNPLSLENYRKNLNIVNENEEVKDFYENFVESGINIEDIDKVYEHSVYKSFYDLLMSKHLQKFSSYIPNQLEKLRRDLKSQDREVMSSYQKEVLLKAHEQSKKAPCGISGSKIKDKTEMELLRHIVQLQNPRISLRDLFDRAYNAITALKPCTLMSPLSVSQILPLDAKYDVLIIDEASQMRPEYSIAGIHRANQIVIVGDKKQLPPTDFFQINIDEGDDEDDLGESILDMASIVLPEKTLLWHYRSKHEGLIKFSNAKFYNNELFIPVTPNTKNKNKGVRNVYLEQGLYRSRSSSGQAGGFNEIEAEKVVSEIVKFMKERPDESLGVVTINRNQRDLVEREFEIKTSGNSDVDKYLEHWSEKDKGLNEFFIKNLENVQGDERDVIFVSTVYGPDKESGKVFQRFGPIAGQYGHRRLNVLITRAKNQIVLFTSLKSHDIQISESSSKGVHVLGDYLYFSETGQLSLSGQKSSRGIESPFQKWAIDQIESFPGFSADWEIGEKGYYIDIGVKHKDYPHGYIMAVETDGATWHSTKSARDRDKLRQEILESYGWKFHRIWSTDWFQDPIGVRKKLKEVLENRLKELKIPQN